jgi:protocatechuate 3,4-dioxygenase, beta subunit
MKTYLILVPVLMLNCLSGCSQNSGRTQNEVKVGGGCEGCEAIYESPVPFEKLESMVWLPDWNEEGTKLAVNGTVYKPDGSPAAGVIIYIYHTDQTGRYTANPNDSGWGKRHGRLRGWMKTDDKGFYKFFTLRPKPYPGRKNPEHIHITIKEPGKSEYWIDEYVFDDDTLLTAYDRKMCQDRGGSGILKISDYYRNRDTQKSSRDIYLGRNVPDYPTEKKPD